ncbi:dihydroneopterin triphosphate diphosphatase [Thiohalobacter sp.]|uniref:dihydroneopterin triphosphate diphosphatase n=1 Tax=Thiohalobacter sp. TaxID=2025948 RepID=UPI00260F5D37|nr:dihydroneopterin triphosphate diphosphatase [Thiohalobacter sp.]
MVPPWKRPESVLVLVHAGGQVLLLERREPRGYWQSVTGSLEWSETPLEAALRELREETGLAPPRIEDCRQSTAFPIHPAWRARYAPDVSENLEHLFRVELPAPIPVEIDPREHHTYQWFPADEAARRVASQTNRQAILNYVGGYS